jgi:hypothetical protein
MQFSLQQDEIVANGQTLGVRAGALCGSGDADGFF